MKTKLILVASILSLTFAAAPNAFGQWWQTPLPIKDDNVYCFMAIGTNLYAGTGHGVFLTTDNGMSWTGKSFGILPPNSVSALTVSGTNLLAAANGVYLSNNNGTSWNPVTQGLVGDGAYVDCFAVSGTNLFAGLTINGSGAGVFLSTTNGTSWTQANTGLATNPSVRALAVSGSNLVAGTNGDVYLTSNNGTGWTDEGASLTVVYGFAVNGANMVAASYAGTGAVWLSSDGGMNWTKTTNGLGGDGVRSVVITGGNIFAGTTSGVFLSTNNGLNWKAVNTGLTYGIYALAVIGTNLFAGTSNGVWREPLSDFGIGQPAIAVSKDTLNFGTHIYGSDSTLTVELRNTSSTPVGIDTEEIIGIGANAQRFAIKSNSKQVSLPYELQLGDSIGFTIAYTAPSNTETNSATFQLPFAETPGTAVRVTLIGSSEPLAGVALEPSNPLSVSVSPNPTDAGTTISFSTASLGNVKIDVFDVLGNNIAASGYEATLAAGIHAEPISLAGLPSGIYYARLQTTTGTQTVKLVKN